MYRYDEFDQDFVNARVAEFSDQVDAPAGRRDHRGPVPAAAADERRLPAAARLHAAHRHSLRHAELASSCACSATSRANTTRATAISRRARTSSSTGRRCPTCRRSWPISPASRCTPSRPRATASATSPPTISPALPPTRSPIRGPMPRSCASGRRCIRNSRILPRKFKIAVTGAERDRAAIQVHDIGLHLKRNDDGRAGLCRLCRRRPGPHADDRQEDPRLPAGGRTCSPTPRRSCASTISTAAATTSTRRASRSSCTRPAPRNSPARSRPSWRR